MAHQIEVVVRISENVPSPNLIKEVSRRIAWAVESFDGSHADLEAEVSGVVSDAVDDFVRAHGDCSS